MSSYLTSTEVFLKYPVLKQKFNWSKRILSILLKNKLLLGYYNRNKRATMIRESSLLQLIDFTLSSINEQAHIH